MCGIAGIVNARLSRDDLEKVLRGFEASLQHRGPDDRGLFISREDSAGLVNTRLAILDLSPAGHQPMTSRDGRYTIAFNGEIYNYAALRAGLLVNGYSLRSHSDTEVVLELFQREGPKCLERLEGMFAIAIWDERERSLFLARDPLGIKPLYYHEKGARILFASELRTLLQSGLLPRELSGEALTGYLASGSVPEPLTLVQDVRVLPAGHYLETKDGRSTLTKFWEIQFAKGHCDMAEAVRRTRSALDDSIRRHHVSDVPVGIFLSGGIDSTAVLALSAQAQERDLRTFSISFDDPKFNEGSVAERTAQHFGARHTDWRLEATTAGQLLEEFLAGSDQPSVDGFNTFCISKLAHDQGLKVVLSGLGGDEVFGGYQSFRMVPLMVKGCERLSLVEPLRRTAGRVLQGAAKSPRHRRLGQFLAGDCSAASAYSAVRGIFTNEEIAQLLPQYCPSESDVPTRNAQLSPLNSVSPQPTLADTVSYLELTRYMRNQLLRDSDVMSMAWNLELRVPLVDKALLDAVSTIPAKVRLAPGKQLLLDAVPEIPEWVRNRPKQGFTFPFETWVTNEWGDRFADIERKSPVKLGNWYRAWSLFALEDFLKRNAIS